MLTREDLFNIIDEELDLLNSNVIRGTYEGKLFYIVTSWEEKEKIEDIQAKYRDQLSKKDQYDDLAGFGDEYFTCSNCNNILCSTPSYYGDTPNYLTLESYILCPNCITNNDIDNYLEEITNNPKRAINTRLINDEKLKELGYIQIEQNFENGFHYDQNDDPKTILQNIQAKNPGEYIFKIDDQGQFDTTFSIWKKEIKEEE